MLALMLLSGLESNVRLRQTNSDVGERTSQVVVFLLAAGDEMDSSEAMFCQQILEMFVFDGYCTSTAQDLAYLAHLP